MENVEKTILIVEDDLALAKLYKTKMELEGYKVVHVSDGMKAMGSIKEHRPDLVLLDIMLPGRNGLEILQDIRDDESIKDLKVIMLTNFGSEENVSTALEFGAVEYVMKYKITPDEMINKIAVVFGDVRDPVVKVTN